MTSIFPLVMVAAAAATGAWVIVSRRRSAFALGLAVGTNASAVLNGELGLPPLISPLALALLGMAFLRAIRADPFRLVRAASRGRSWLPSAVFGAIAAVVLSAALGPFVSVDARSSADAVGRLLELLLVAAAAASVATHPRGMRALLWGLASAGFVLSLITNIQALVGATATTAYGFGSWNQEVIGGVGDAFRAAGPFGDDPNVFAQYLVVMGGVALGLAVATTDEVSPRQRRILLLFALSMALGVVHTASRGGIIGFSAVVTVALIIRGLDRRIVIVGIAFVAALAGPLGVGDRLGSLGTSPTAQTADSGLRGRASEMIAAAQMFTDHPIGGVGYGTYNDRYLDYSRTIGIDPRFELRSAHSLPLEIAAEQGVVGLSAWTALFALTGVVIIRLRRSWNDLGTAYGIGAFGFAVTSLFLHDVHPSLMWTLIGLALGGAVAIDRRDRRSPGAQPASPVRVAMVIQSYVPAIGGAERQLANLMPALVERGVKPIVITRSMPGRPRDDEVDGIPVVRLRVAGPKPLRSMLFVAQARAVLAWFDPHVVHAFDSMTPSSIARGQRVETGTPFATKILRSGELGDLHRLAVKPFGAIRLHRLLRDADSMIAVSADIGEELVSLGLPADRIARIPNGVDTGRFHPTNHRTRSPDGRIDVIATGRLAPEKRLVELASRWDRVTAAWPDARLVLVGDGPESDRLDGIDGVELLGQRSNVAELLRDADVYVSASCAEGLSNSLLEAMASGLPCVVTDVGGVRDLIRQPSQGVVVPVDDLDQLVAELIALIGDVDRRRRMRRAARRRVFDENALVRTAERLVDLYSELARAPFTPTSNLDRAAQSSPRTLDGAMT